MKNALIALLCLIILTAACSRSGTGPDTGTAMPKDSIALWIAQAKDTTGAEKIRLLEKAYHAAQPLSDTLKLKYMEDISYYYSKTSDSIQFRKTNTEIRQLAIKLKDSSSLADIYWDMGLYFSRIGKNDSSFYYYTKAQRLYEQLNNDFYSARMLINMAMKQIDIKDYTGGEINSIKAIAVVKPLKKYRQLYDGYNNLGIIFNRLEDYDKALAYHYQALEYLQKSNRKNNYEPMSLNNIGIVYKNQGNYRNAIKKYSEARAHNKRYAKDPQWEATLIDNIAYVRFKAGETAGIPEMFFQALTLSDSLNYMQGMIASNRNLAEYYETYNDTINALKYARKTRELAAASNTHSDLLESLLLLSRLEKGAKSAGWLNRYITINDSLQKAERRIREKFTRIQFETDQLALEKQELIKDRATSRRWIIGLGIAAALAGVFTLYYYQRQRLYRQRFTALLEEKDFGESSPPSKTVKNTEKKLNMSDAALEHITQKLKAFVENKQFLHKDISLYSLAKAMQTNPKYLSRVINFYKKKSFIAYLHELRIDHVLETLKTDAVFRKYSIQAIGEEAGFKNSDSFSRAFYRKTGIYPSYFIRELEKKIEPEQEKKPLEIQF